MPTLDGLTPEKQKHFILHYECLPVGTISYMCATKMIFWMLIYYISILHSTWNDDALDNPCDIYILWHFMGYHVVESIKFTFEKVNTVVHGKNEALCETWNVEIYVVSHQFFFMLLLELWEVARP